MAHEFPLQQGHGFHQADIIVPELVRRMTKIGLQQRDRVDCCQSVWRKRWIREDADKSCLGERAGRPSRAPQLRKPALHFAVRLVTRPRHRDQYIDVEQTGPGHSSSSCSLRICSPVTVGDPWGSSTTWNPFTRRVCSGACKPRRTNSDTAFPSAMSRLSAYTFTSRRTSSSIDRVVLMHP